MIEYILLIVIMHKEKYMEIERKFLIDKLPPLDGVECEKIEQGYVLLSPEVRVRQKGDKFYYTEKSDGTLVRKEYEKEITEAEYREFLAKICGEIVEKTRYYIPLGKYTAELDVYGGRHAGLCVCEVEFECEEEAMAFIPPDWFGKDVSDDKRYKNKNLSQE